MKEKNNVIEGFSERQVEISLWVISLLIVFIGGTVLGIFMSKCKVPKTSSFY